ncbi:MAG: thioesterase [Candidatus Kapaibacterium sp.]|nr:MAG: thioesterase [Candidatus Kapabacteria bacterium]
MKPDVRSSSATVQITVTPDMAASLDGRVIHPLYATFWLAYHAEVVARKAIEPFFEDGENAVGAGLQLEHRGMCPIGASVTVTATVVDYTDNRIVCSILARTTQTEIARGTQTQIVLPATTIADKVARAYAMHGLPLP